MGVSFSKLGRVSALFKSECASQHPELCFDFAVSCFFHSTTMVNSEHSGVSGISGFQCMYEDSTVGSITKSGR